MTRRNNPMKTLLAWLAAIFTGMVVATWLAGLWASQFNYDQAHLDAIAESHRPYAGPPARPQLFPHGGPGRSRRTDRYHHLQTGAPQL